MKSYKIIRKFKDRTRGYVVARGLTIDEAQKHCRDPETSSSTCTLSHRTAITDQFGDWFDCYEEEVEE